LATLRICDREQVKCIAGFGSTSRANARLLALHRAGLLRRYFIGTEAGGRKALYAVSEGGANLVQVPCRGLRRRQNEMLVADFSVVHQLAVNALYCAWKKDQGSALRQWRTFHESVTKKFDLVPDAYAEFDLPSRKIATFIEVDLGHEGMATLKRKAERYQELALSEKFTTPVAGNRFRVLVLAHSEQRVRSIRATVAKVTKKIFWFGTVTNAHRDGLRAPVWLRPEGNQRKAFLEETP
jgi:hypothetical protein